MQDSQLNFPKSIRKEKQDQDDFDIKQVISLLIRFWPLFISCILAALIAAFLFLRYTTSQYKINAKVLVKDDKKGNDMSGQEMFEDFGLFSGSKSVDNEVEVLKSRTLMEKTVEALQLNVRYFIEGSVKQSEVFFGKLPFKMILYNLQEDSLKGNEIYTFTNIDNSRFAFNDGSFNRIKKYTDTIVMPFGTITFQKQPLYREDSHLPVTIKLFKKDNTVEAFQNALAVSTTSKTVSTIDLTLEDAVPERGEKLLNTLISIYNAMNTEDKNRIADSTISFIDSRLVFVTAELGDVEKEIETFKRKNKITDLEAQGKLLLESNSDEMKDLQQQEVQIDVINSLEKYLKDDKNNQKTIPAGLAVPDPTFAQLVQSYNMAQLEKERQMQTTTENNPVVQTINAGIATLKTNILANLATIGKTMQINRSQLQKGTNSFENLLQKVPSKEKTFLEFSRQQAIKQELYLYLLKKREETAVSKAANIDNARVIDAAKSQRTPFSPKRNLVYLSALLAGLILPSLIIYIQHLLNNKVDSKKDITSQTTAPILGEIGRTPYTNGLVVIENNRHPVAEQFRLLRTNLEFMLPKTDVGRLIMITSSMSGEGKSFLSLNLASILALGGKKVVLVEFDLRKPKLSKYLGVENSEGLTSFLIKKNNDIARLLKPVPQFESLFLLSSGPIPPNPAELINNEQTKELFLQLKKDFDHIVVDVPPVGVVADALLLAVYMDISLYIVRQKYTLKTQLEFLDELYQQKKLPGFGIVVNDIKKQKGYGYSYSYGYGYGYAENSKE